KSLTWLDYEQRLLHRASRWTADATLAELTCERLQKIAAHEGTDFATALLYDRVARSPQHGPFISEVDALAETMDDRGYVPATVVIVPGALYREFPHTGADGRLVREQAEAMGCRCELVPISTMGCLAENAAAICGWLSRCRFENIILVT